MPICKSCGAEMGEGKNSCSACGALLAPVTESACPAPEADPAAPAGAAMPPVPATPEAAPEAEPVCEAPAAAVPSANAAAAQSRTSGVSAVPPAAPFIRDPRPAKGSRWAPVTLGGWIGILLLLCIPVVNFILVIVWSCGGCKKRVKADFARAVLILSLITALLYMTAAIVMIANPYLFAKIGAYLSDIFMRLF